VESLDSQYRKEGTEESPAEHNGHYTHAAPEIRQDNPRQYRMGNHISK